MSTGTIMGDDDQGPSWTMRLRTRVADFRGRGIYAGYPNRYRCIFIHVPKTAGTSVARALFGAESRHVPYIEYQRANPTKFRNYFKFAFVRNPWDRLVSTYFFLKRGGMSEMDRLWAEKNLSAYSDFDAFIRGWLTEASVASWVHFRPQSDFILDGNGVVTVDFVGRYERLPDDFSFIAKRLGRDVPLLKSNRSDHDDYRSYYTPETRALVGRVYERDLKAFAYEFGD